ncbi:MAG: hypothetical protein ACJ8D7_01145 [Xanthobacteraceae bacterium]
MISLLQVSVIFLLLTNAASLAAAVYALRSANRSGPQHKSAIERNVEAMLRRAK